MNFFEIQLGIGLLNKSTFYRMYWNCNPVKVCKTSNGLMWGEGNVDLRYPKALPGLWSEGKEIAALLAMQTHESQPTLPLSLFLLFLSLSNLHKFEMVSNRIEYPWATIFATRGGCLLHPSFI